MNKIMLHLYLDRLDRERQAVFHKLAAFAGEYALAGGTAMMLQIGHRLSYDFDCFSASTPSKLVIPKIKRVFSVTGSPTISTPEMISFTLPGNIDISFVWDPYPLTKPSIKTSGISLYHLDDLVTNKAITIGRRPAWRDYVDLFFFLKWNIYKLKDIITKSCQRFGGEFNEKLFLQQLTYFDDVPIAETVFLKDSYTPEEIKLFLQRQVASYLKTILPTG